MAGYIIIGMLAAFGLLSALWAIAGLWLPRQPGAAVVVFSTGDHREESTLRRYRWLKSLGLVSCPLILVDGTPQEDIICCTSDELTALLEQEWDQIGRART